MAQTEPALVPRKESDINRVHDDGQPILTFVKYPEGTDYTEEMAFAAEMKARTVLGSNRAIVSPYKRGETSTWSWTARCISSLTGGMTSGQDPGLQHPVEWQCKYWSRSMLNSADVNVSSRKKAARNGWESTHGDRTPRGVPANRRGRVRSR